MLTDRPDEQNTLYKEIMVKKLSVRDAEKVARKIAQDRVRKKEFVVDPAIRNYEKQLSENLGTRVHIEPKENGGQITIDYFTIKDLETILASMQKVERENSMMDSYLKGRPSASEVITSTTPLVAKAPQEEDSYDPEPRAEEVIEDIEIFEEVKEDVRVPEIQPDPNLSDIRDDNEPNSGPEYEKEEMRHENDSASDEWVIPEDEPAKQEPPRPEPTYPQPGYQNQVRQDVPYYQPDPRRQYPPQNVHYGRPPERKGIFGRLFG